MKQCVNKDLQKDESKHLLPHNKTLGYTSSHTALIIQREEMPMPDTIGYCVKCKAKSGMKDVKEVTMKNGRKAAKGKCTKCGTGMYKILPKK